MPTLPAIYFMGTAAKGAFKNSLSVPCLKLCSGFLPPHNIVWSLPTLCLLYLLFSLTLAHSLLATGASSLFLKLTSSSHLRAFAHATPLPHWLPPPYPGRGALTPTLPHVTRSLLRGPASCSVEHPLFSESTLLAACVFIMSHQPFPLQFVSSGTPGTSSVWGSAESPVPAGVR